MPGVRARPRRGAFGLRGRIVGAVVVTTVATLAVAAIALLGPLEQSLRHTALTTLERDLKHQALNFKQLKLTYLGESTASQSSLPPQLRDPHAADGDAERQQVSRLETSLGQRLGASVTLLGFPDAVGHFRPVLKSDFAESVGDTYDDASEALAAPS